jgi:hypothetical protein
MDGSIDKAKDANERLGGNAMSAVSIPLVVYVDVDDTFVRSVGTKRIPMQRVLAHVRALHAQGVKLYCWSSGGSEYARSSAAEFEVEHCFAGFLPKPNVLLDDQSVADWRLCLEVHPLSISNETADEYWRAIETRHRS